MNTFVSRLLLISFICLSIPHSHAELVDVLYSAIKKNGPLSIGMSQKEVEKVIGLPNNKDSEIVWLWVSANADRIETWKLILDPTRRKQYGVSCFLVFADGKLITPLPMLVSKDADSLYRIELKNKDK